MRIRTKVIVTLLTGLAGFAGAEIAARVLQLGPMPYPLEDGAIVRHSDDPDLGVELIPGGVLRVQYLNRRREHVREALAVVNSQGFRGPVVPRPKPAGTFRIVCLGDSQTFGNGVGEGESWPAALGAALREAAPDASFDVMNCGVGGYETEQEVAYLEKRLLAYEPDLVILGFFMNDTALRGASVEPPTATLGRLIEFFSPGRTGVLPALRRYSRLLDLGSDWIFRRLAMSRWIDQREELYRDDFDGWVRVRAALRHARELVEARGGRFVVLLVPLLMLDRGELLSAQPYRTISSFGRSEGIPCFDPAPFFAGLDVDHMRVHERDLHSDGRGHRIVGQSLATWLREQGYFPGAAGRSGPAPR